MSFMFSGTIEVVRLIAAMGGCICSKQVVTIDGTKYRIMERIAEGGFSTIDLVESARSRKRFALKRVTCHSTEDQNLASQEVEYHKLLDHPNILKIEGSSVLGRADISHNTTSDVLLLLPYFPRGSLHDELVRREQKKDPFSESTILSIFSQICKAVLYMHTMSPEPLAHRDLKPHNILLTDDYTPIIMDLGSVTKARVTINNHSEAQYLQDTAAERSSMPYRAPELFAVNSRCSIDERTDVWSLGCLLYAICFYRSPFDSVFERGDSVALAVQSGSKSVRFPANCAFSSGLKDLILSMINADFSERPHVSEVLLTLECISKANEDRL